MEGKIIKNSEETTEFISQIISKETTEIHIEQYTKYNELGNTEKMIQKLSIDVEVETFQAKLLRASPIVRAETASGHLGNLSLEQIKKLYNLWGMVIEYLQKPYDENQKKKDKQLIAEMYDQSVLTASSNSSLNESLRSQTSSSRSSAIKSNPLSTEFWCQAATGDLDVLILRFLRARKWNLNDAFEMLIATLRWRYSYQVRNVLMEGEAGIKKELLESGKSFFWKVDNLGRTICVITGRLHDKNAQTLEETSRHTVFQMELGRRLMLPNTETVTVVFDMANAPLCSLDLSSTQFMVSCFQNYYPESLGKCLIINPPWIFSGFLRMVKPLLDPVVAAKIEIVTPGPEILKFIPPENLQKSFGGASKYEYEYIPPAENESKTNHLGPDELIQLELELEDLQTRLVDTAVAINSLFVNQEIQINENDLTLVALLEICSDLKQQISSRWALIDAHFIPKNMYHRLGVMQENGEICWPSN